MTQAMTLVVLLGMSSCVVGPTPPPDPPPKPTPSGYTCESACAQLRYLNCEAAQGSPGRDDAMGTPDDESCEQVCHSVEDTVPMAVECITTATTCDEADACG